MDINHQKEQFSIAYVRAIISAAGYTVYKLDIDEDSVDLGIAGKGGKGTFCSPHLEMQLKCTAIANYDNGYLRYPLKIKNYDDLRRINLHVPQILVTVIVPKELKDWLEQSEEALTMYKCGYWTSLRGKPETKNTKTVTVHLPKRNLFTVEELKRIMSRISDGEAI